MGRWYELNIDMDTNDTFIVAAPDFPEVTTFGDDLEAAHVNGRRAIEEAIAARISYGDPIPLPKDDGTGQYSIQISGKYDL